MTDDTHADRRALGLGERDHEVEKVSTELRRLDRSRTIGLGPRGLLLARSPSFVGPEPLAIDVTRDRREPAA